MCVCVCVGGVRIFWCDGIILQACAVCRLATRERLVFFSSLFCSPETSEVKRKNKREKHRVSVQSGEEALLSGKTATIRSYR